MIANRVGVDAFMINPFVRNADKSQARDKKRISTVTICGSPGPICGSVITAGLRLGSGMGLALGFWVRVRVQVRVADCCVQTAGESEKMWINHVIKTDQWRAAPQIRPAPHFVRVPD